MRRGFEMTASRENRMPLLPVIAAGGDRGTKVADVICAMIVQGERAGLEKGERLAELQAITILDQGAPRQIVLPPMLWFDRLMLAVERGAIETMSAQAITQKILRPIGQGK